jgi:hypothetical protein
VNPSSSDGALHSRTPTFFFSQHTSPPFPWFERCATRSALHLAVTNGLRLPITRVLLCVQEEAYAR